MHHLAFVTYLPGYLNLNWIKFRACFRIKVWFPSRFQITTHLGSENSDIPNNSGGEWFPPASTFSMAPNSWSLIFARLGFGLLRGKRRNVPLNCQWLVQRNSPDLVPSPLENSDMKVWWPVGVFPRERVRGFLEQTKFVIHVLAKTFQAVTKYPTKQAVFVRVFRMKITSIKLRTFQALKIAENHSKGCMPFSRFPECDHFGGVNSLAVLRISGYKSLPWPRNYHIIFRRHGGMSMIFNFQCWIWTHSLQSNH